MMTSFTIVTLIIIGYLIAVLMMLTEALKDANMKEGSNAMAGSVIVILLVVCYVLL